MKSLTLLFLLAANLLFSQEFRLKENQKTSISFQLINNLIFIPVTINGVQLTFLLDSGVSETILFSLENKQIDFKNTEKITFTGLGGTREIQGLKASNNIVQIGKHFIDDQHNLYLILDEEFNFSDHIGIPVNGIIGYQFFKNHAFKIDYITQKITIYPDEKAVNKEKNKNYQGFDITIELNKPYIIADVEQTNTVTPSKLLIDLGNSDAMWLFPSLIPNFKYNRPNIEDYLGRGFNGDIYGKRSRIHSLRIGDYKVEKPLIAMPDEYSIQHLKLVKDRKGSIGNDTFRRFSVLLDYPSKKIYLKKNKNFDEAFHFNMSGLDVKHDGMVWDKALVSIKKESNDSPNKVGSQVYNESAALQYKFVLVPEFSVSGSREDSPAYKAGVRKGDKILKVNNKSAKTMTLQKFRDLFMSEVGKTIKLEIERLGLIYIYNFTLEDPIPYQED